MGGKKTLLSPLCWTSLFLWWVPADLSTPAASNISEQTNFVIIVNARVLVESSAASALFLSHRGMTNDAKHDLLLLSCDCKRTRFPLDSLTPINSTMLFFLGFFLKKSYLSGPPSASSSPLHPLSVPPLFPWFCFMFYCHGWKLSHNFLTALFKGHPPPFLHFPPFFHTHFLPLPLGRPLIQHTQ